MNKKFIICNEVTGKFVVSILGADHVNRPVLNPNETSRVFSAIIFSCEKDAQEQADRLNEFAADGIYSVQEVVYSANDSVKEKPLELVGDEWRHTGDLVVSRFDIVGNN